VVVTADTFVEVIHQLLVESRSGEVRAVVHRAASGDAEAIAERIVGSDGAASLFRQLMLWSIFCSEPWAAYDVRDVAQVGRHSYLGASQVAFAGNVRLICRMMPRRSPRSWESETVRSTMPVLLLNGTVDPPGSAGERGGRSSRARAQPHRPVRGYGHTVGHIGCLPGIVAAFFMGDGQPGYQMRAGAADASVLDPLILEPGPQGGNESRRVKPAPSGTPR
jgi:hypothetical protein